MKPPYARRDPHAPSVHELLDQTRCLLRLLHQMPIARRARLVPVLVNQLVGEAGTGHEAATWSRGDHAEAIDQIGDVLVDLLQDGLALPSERDRVTASIERCLDAVRRELCPSQV